MRYQIPASANARSQPVRILHDAHVSHVKIQVNDPVTLFVSKRRMDLEATDAVGNPAKGFKLAQGITEFFFVSGELWVTCNQQVEIEADAWPLPWIIPGIAVGE